MGRMFPLQECQEEPTMIFLHYINHLVSFSSINQPFLCQLNILESTWVAFLGSNYTYITPAVDALHLPHHGYPGMPVVAVLVIVLAKFAVSRTICLHHVTVLQACRGSVLIRTLLTAVGGIPSHWMTACQHRTRHLLTVHLACWALWIQCRVSSRL